jgi:hypothetical protein
MNEKSKKGYQLLIEDKKKQNPEFDEKCDELYSHEIKRETETYHITEELNVFIHTEDHCNMCGKLIPQSVLLHYMKDYTSKNKNISDDVIEEEIVLCDDCIDKLSKLLKVG